MEQTDSYMETENDSVRKDRRKGGGWKKYLGFGVTAFLVLAACVLLAFVFVRHEEFKKAVGSIKTALTPAIYGAVFAYLMNPLMKFFEEKQKNIYHKFAKNIRRADKVARVLAIILTLIVVLFLIGFLMYMLIPELTATISNLGNTVPEQYEKLEAWYLGLDIRTTKVGEVLDNGIIKIGEYINGFINNKQLLDTLSNLVNPVLNGVKGVFGALYNTFIGLIFSIYLLGYKEKLIGISKKILYSLMKRRHANTFIRISRQCNVKFTTSFTGKIVDSIIVGMICFLAMTLIGLPYAVLISVLVGVTNVIPFFGPIIGAVPGAFLILVSNPLQCLYFIILIVVLQQLDANVLTPKIVGDTIGLSPIWVLFGCVFFGSLWGVVGMLLAVPLMACIYMIVKEVVETRLYRKGLNIETNYYESLEYEDETEVIRINPDGSVADDMIVSADDGLLHKTDNVTGEENTDAVTDDSVLQKDPAAETENRSLKPDQTAEKSIAKPSAGSVNRNTSEKGGRRIIRKAVSVLKNRKDRKKKNNE